MCGGGIRWGYGQIDDGENGLFSAITRPQCHLDVSMFELSVKILSSTGPSTYAFPGGGEGMRDGELPQDPSFHKRLPTCASSLAHPSFAKGCLSP